MSAGLAYDKKSLAYKEISGKFSIGRRRKRKVQPDGYTASVSVAAIENIFMMKSSIGFVYFLAPLKQGMSSRTVNPPAARVIASDKQAER